jgi:hypothetical protein
MQKVFSQTPFIGGSCFPEPRNWCNDQGSWGNAKYLEVCAGDFTHGGSCQNCCYRIVFYERYVINGNFKNYQSNVVAVLPTSEDCTCNVSMDSILINFERKLFLNKSANDPGFWMKFKDTPDDVHDDCYLNSSSAHDNTVTQYFYVSGGCFKKDINGDTLKDINGNPVNCDDAYLFCCRQGNWIETYMIGNKPDWHSNGVIMDIYPTNPDNILIQENSSDCMRCEEDLNSNCLSRCNNPVYKDCHCDDYNSNFNVVYKPKTQQSDLCCLTFSFNFNSKMGDCCIQKVEIFDKINNTDVLIHTWDNTYMQPIPFGDFDYCDVNLLNRIGQTVTFTLKYTLIDGRSCSTTKSIEIRCPEPCAQWQNADPTIVFVPDINNAESDKCCYDIYIYNPNNVALVFNHIRFELSKPIAYSIFASDNISIKLNDVNNNPNKWYANLPTLPSLITFGQYKDDRTSIIITNLPANMAESDKIKIGSICIPKDAGSVIVTTSWGYGPEYCQMGSPFELQCDTACCKEELFELTVSPGGDGTICGEDQCVITGKIKMPDVLNCNGGPFTRYSINNSFKYTIPTDGIITQYQFNSIGCLNKGESRIETLKLYKGMDDQNPCVITKNVYCPFETVVESCTPDCQSVAWHKGGTIPARELPNCPNCSLSVEYSYRTNNCPPHNIEPLQEIQIDKITVESKNNADCSACMSDEDLYKLALKRAIFDGGTGFQPQPSVYGCYDTWRVVQASCWVHYKDYLFQPAGGVVVYEPCANTECCSIGLTVCRIDADPNDYISITSNGTITGGNSCTGTKKVYDPSGFGTPIYNTNGPVSYNTTMTLPCQDRCDWLNIDDSQFNNYEYYGKESYNDFDFQLINPGDELKLNITVKKDLLDCYIFSNIKTENCNIAIYNILGQSLINNSYNLKKGMNDFSLNIDDLNSGMYIIQVNVDGIVQRTEKFIILK